jgi:hypothetical protein
LVFGVAITLLKAPFELILLAGDDIEIIIGQLAPLLFYFALDLLPISIRRPRDTPIWKLEASLKCRSCRKGRSAPPVRMIKELRYMGKVGTAWSRTISSQIRKQLDTVVSPKSKLTKPIRKPKATWVEPKFFADVEYRDITSEGLLRASSFKGLSKGTGRT